MTKKGAVELLFNLGRVWDPIFWIYEGTEEQEEPVFGACLYSLGLREALGKKAWTDEQLAEWKLKNGYKA